MTDADNIVLQERTNQEKLKRVYAKKAEDFEQEARSSEPHLWMDYRNMTLSMTRK